MRFPALSPMQTQPIHNLKAPTPYNLPQTHSFLVAASQPLIDFTSLMLQELTQHPVEILTLAVALKPGIKLLSPNEHLAVELETEGKR